MWSQGLNICTSSSSMWRGLDESLRPFQIKNRYGHRECNPVWVCGLGSEYLTLVL